MAEGYLKHFAGDRAVIFSAGTEKHGLNPRAVQSMKEDGIDISSQTSNQVNEYLHEDIDMIITVCDHARENCPVFPGKAHKFHESFPDPAIATGSEEEIRNQFNAVRDLIKEYCRLFVQNQL